MYFDVNREMKRSYARGIAKGRQIERRIALVCFVVGLVAFEIIHKIVDMVMGC